MDLCYQSWKKKVLISSHIFLIHLFFPGVDPLTLVNANELTLRGLGINSNVEQILHTLKALFNAVRKHDGTGMLYSFLCLLILDALQKKLSVSNSRYRSDKSHPSFSKPTMCASSASAEDWYIFEKTYRGAANQILFKPENKSKFQSNGVKKNFTLR